MPTFLAAAGDDKIKEKLLKGHTAGDKTFKLHLDGYNFLPYLTGKEEKSPRNEIFYFAETGNLEAVRVGKIKATFIHPTEESWFAPRLASTWPELVDLRADPYEEAPEHSGMYLRWYAERMFHFVPVQVEVAGLLQTFNEFPLRQEPTAFNLDRVLSTLPYREAK